MVIFKHADDLDGEDLIAMEQVPMPAALSAWTNRQRRARAPTSSSRSDHSGHAGSGDALAIGAGSCPDILGMGGVTVSYLEDSRTCSER